MDHLILGLDIGGTKIAAGWLTLDGKLVAREEVPTEQERGFHHSSGQMYRLVESLLEHPACSGAKIIGIGACAPGPMDTQQGVLVNPPNLSGWENLPLQDLLQKRYGLPVRLDNDANAAGLAETLWGAAKGCDHVFYATVSTGIGTGIILHRKVLHGKSGMAGEGGHVSIHSQDDALRCNCGNLGCIEAYASGPSAARRAREKLEALPEKPPILEQETGGRWEQLTMRHIARAAARGDLFSRNLIHETGTFLGIWLGGIISMLDPDIIVIGGGVSRIGDPLFDVIRKEIPSRTINIHATDTPVVRARLDKDVGIYGGAALVMDLSTFC